MRYQLSDNTWDQKEFAVIQEVLDSNMFSMCRRVSQ